MFKMVALKQFDGLEGFMEPGAEFEVERKDRAEALEEHGLAKPVKKAALKKEDKEAN